MSNVSSVECKSMHFESFLLTQFFHTIRINWAEDIKLLKQCKFWSLSEINLSFGFRSLAMNSINIIWAILVHFSRAFASFFKLESFISMLHGKEWPEHSLKYLLLGSKYEGELCRFASTWGRQNCHFWVNSLTVKDKPLQVKLVKSCSNRKCVNGDTKITQ